MIICFFSDVHGNKYAFDAFIDEVNNKSIDMFIFGGDFFGYYYDQEYIISKMRDKNIHCLLGNHDKFFLELLDNKIKEEQLVSLYGNSYKDIKYKISKKNITFIESLQSSFELKVDSLKLGFFHGSPDNSIEGRVYPDTYIDKARNYIKYDYLFLGHTHHKMVKKVKNSLVLNPGSIGQQRDGKGTSYLLFNTMTRKCQIKIVEYPVQELIKQIDLYENNNLEMNFRLKEVLLRKK